MELATLFTVAYRYEVPIGPIMLVSDMRCSDAASGQEAVGRNLFQVHGHHLDIGIDAGLEAERQWNKVRASLTPNGNEIVAQR